MDGHIRASLDNSVREFSNLIAQRASYAALVKLAGIENVIEHVLEDSSVAREWRQTLQNISIADIAIEDAIATANSSEEKLRRLLSVGSSYEFEELVLAITLRIELELFETFLCSRGKRSGQTVGSMDEDLRSISESPGNAKIFSSAKIAVRRNWGLPIVSAWLRD